MTDSVPSTLIRVSAVVLRDEAGHILTVRKRGTSRFMLPGGKPEAGESAAQAAVRECQEEIHVTLEAADLELLGTFTAPAANEPGHQVEGTVFLHAAVEVDRPAAEIDELRWLDPAAPLPGDLAPLLEHHVLPLLG
ncbi:NUDIX domain-containing protein [Demequina sp. NBRC 110057]|uniref:NUDIX hydrolase n=1 Tax=Demequina sp. NBRC 110057 TaxID=1570346 RepID=UPI000A01CA40|nr:NUDIX domain-containing protein [Demequina sp. NBRC 110057]